MSQITLVRHGQANTHARDEQSYDLLSELGHQQARWLGEHLETTNEPFMRVYSGTMRRHIETAESLGAPRYAEIVQDARLNEMAYYDLSNRMYEQHGLRVPDSREGFAEHLPIVLSAWEQGEIADAPESYQDFSGRIQAVIAEISAGEGPALVVTSGGLIGEVMRQTLALDARGWARMCLAIMNTSVHRMHDLLGAPLLTQFNGVPHLEHPDRQYAQTHL